jgi:RNA polymerase sigma factor (sigma-70 family)
VKTKLPAADYRRLSDEELAHRFTHRRDQAAITFLFERYGHLVMGVCLKHLKQVNASREATEQIFIKLLDDLHKFKIDRFKTWLYQTTQTFCTAALNVEMAVRSNHEEADADEDWYRRIEQEHLYDKLELALSKLSREKRICIELFYMDKMTYAEIAERTGFSTAQVKAFLQEGKQDLETKIEALTDVKQ